MNPDQDQAAWAATQPMPATLSANELTRALTDAGVPPACIALFDEDFALVTPAWITGPLADAYRDLLFKLGIRWTEDQFDCNKFAKLATTVADLCWVTTRQEDAALAFGMFATPAHMLCVAVHRDDSAPGTLRVAFYEPQPSVPEGEMVFAAVPLRETRLTRAQIQTALACIFA